MVVAPARRCFVLLASVLLCALTGIVAAASPAAAATIDCTPMGDAACRLLSPVLECAWQNQDGTRTLVWGYDNPSSDVLRIDIGNKNRMSPGAEDQGQPTMFQPGRHLNVFTTVVAGDSADWRLGNNTASLARSTATCEGHQVTAFGDAAALALGVGLLLSLGVPVLAARPRGVDA